MARSLPILAAAALLAAAAGCDAPTDSLATVRLSVGTASDVAGVLYEVTCDDGTTATAYVPLEPEPLPSHAGPGLPFADLFLLAGEGSCTVTATAMADEATPEPGCLPAEAVIQLLPEQTTEVLLTIQCGPADGSVDIISLVNQVPTVDVTLDPGPELEPCDTLVLTADASDPDGGDVTLAWDVQPWGDTKPATWDVTDDGVLTLTPGGVGAYDIVITASDGVGASVTTVTITVDGVAVGACP